MLKSVKICANWDEFVASIQTQVYLNVNHDFHHHIKHRLPGGLNLIRQT